MSPTIPRPVAVAVVVAVVAVVAVLAPLAMPAGVPPAHAAESAGTQSVFAYGAGNRALAMGTAFVAAADDASATVWNPAGLGLLSRSQVEAVQSVDLGFGATESYVAVALPNWRIGAAGLVFRQFSVGGIERRDDRNVLLEEDLSDSEMEVALGFGRAVSEAVSVGGAFKLQRQSLAGLSGSGLGVDVGVNARPAAVLKTNASWAEGLRFGFAVRNLIEPGIRLDRESVGDPVAFRTGLAWQGTGPGGAGVLAEVDWSQVPKAGGGLHAGVEYRVHPAASFRFGMNGGTFTAGAGLNLRDLSLDYAFENTALASGHRAGLSFRFGATTDESRMAHQKKEDELVERRLAEAFRQRQAEQVASLFDRAAEAHARGDFDEAIDAVSLILSIEPENPEALRLEVAYLRDKARALEASEEFASAALVWDRALARSPGDVEAQAGGTRCREESDRRAQRGNAIRARFARAMEAFASEDWQQARAGFRTVLAVDPTDQEAKRMLERTEQAIERRAAEQAEQAVTAARLQRAAERADSARARSARHPVPQAPAGPQMTDREIEDLYQRGLTALAAQRSDDALRYWELVWSARPGYREVAAHLKREYLARGLDSFAAGRLDDAVAQWERAQRVDPSDPRVKGYLERARKQLSRSREILGTRP